jgi:hypothetical protein
MVQYKHQSICGFDLTRKQAADLDYDLVEKLKNGSVQSRNIAASKCFWTHAKRLFS